MTERHGPRLPRAAEALLSGWPAPERSAEEWARSADAILHRVESGATGEVDEALFSAPLPQTEEDGALPERRSSPDMTGPSLTDIARSKVKSEDRNRQLAVAKDSLKHAAEARHTGQTAEHVARTAEIAELERHREERQSSIPDQRGASWRGAAVGATVALLAAAAAFMFYVSGERAELLSPAPERAEVAAAPTENPAVVEGTDNEEPGADVEELPAAEHEAKEVEPRPRVSRPGTHTPKLAQVEKPVEGNQAEPPAPEPDEFDTRLPSADDSEVHERIAPTTGEALAAVAPSTVRARVCVAGHTKPSTATITFGSNGAVESVAVSGPAAGTPAADCIRNAFLTARLAPFAQPRFTVNLPVRP